MELWCPLVTHVSIAAELEDLTHSGTSHACLFVMFTFARFGLFLVWRYSMYLFIYSVFTPFAGVASLVSEQRGQNIVITAGQLD